MKIENYNQLADSIERDRTMRDVQRASEGMLLIASKTPLPYSLCAEHDVLYCHGPSPEDACWSDTELHRLATLGWSWSESDGWVIFV